MFLGFRAGDDPAISIKKNDFRGMRQVLMLTDGAATLGRVFPDGAEFDASVSPDRVVAKVRTACQPVFDAGMWPYLSLKPDVLQAIAGRLDLHLTAVATWIAGLNAPVYFSVWHEPENDPMGAGVLKDHGNHRGRAENFVAVHNRAYDLMKRIAGDRLRMGPCHMSYQWRPGSQTTSETGGIADAWRVDEDRADFYAVDTYTSNWSWKPGQAHLGKKPDFQRWLNLIAPPAGKLVIAERGISANYDGVDDPEAAQSTILAQDINYLTGIGAHAFLYWNSGGAEDNSKYLLGAPGRSVFTRLAAAAAKAQPAGDRYDEGLRDGLAKGAAFGSKTAYREMAEWANGKADKV